ncbi:MAG: M28 family peptidase [Acidobacteria bacterium]|nr:M28 family peptidase [Acidobacteriota bacterium]
MWTRRTFSAALAGAAAPGGAAIALLEIARAHVHLTEQDKGKRPLWGRLGGSETERKSSRLLAKQLGAHLKTVSLESFRFEAHRPKQWRVIVRGRPLESAMPAPVEARFPEGESRAPLVSGNPDADWALHAGKWVFVESQPGRGAANTIVRERLLYQKAAAAKAAGLIFAVATPQDAVWRSVVPVDKPYAVKDERYPDGRRPIPCFAVDTGDGRLLAEAAAGGNELRASILYEPQAAHEGQNVVAHLAGQGKNCAAIMNHIDSFFAGACDNATGIATMVGLAQRLAALPVERRPADVYFLGLSAHHDSAAGMRDFAARDPTRFSAIRQFILIEHTDAVDTEEARRAGWRLPLRNHRTAYLGSQGWPEVKAALPRLVSDSGVMTIDPPVQDACIADLFVVCGQARTFCLMGAPPYYHTDHDTIDKISSKGLEAGVDFHMRLLAVCGVVT